MRRLLPADFSSEGSRVRLEGQAPLIGTPLWRRGCWLPAHGPSAPAHMAHRANSPALQALPPFAATPPRCTRPRAGSESACGLPRGAAPTLDQTAPCIISSSSPGSGRRRCGDQLGPWSVDPGQGSTLPTTTSAPSARPQSCPSHSFLGVKRSDSFPPTGSGLQQSKRCEPAGRGRAASRACPPAFCPPPAPAPSS